MPTEKTGLPAQLVVPPELIERRIYLIRGLKVMLDSDLARLYRVPTSRLNEAVKRNRNRFPSDFMFQLTKKELQNWRSQFAISNPQAKMALRRPPFAFTEHGVAMLSSVLRSRRAVQVNIFIIRVFMKLREVLATHKDLTHKIEQLEDTDRRHGQMLGLVIKDIQQLATNVSNEFKKLKAPRRRKARIGFLSF